MVALSAVVLEGCGSGDGTSAKPGPPVTLPAATTSSAVSTSTSRGTSATSTATRGGGPALNAASTVNLRGVGPVRVEMTLPEASNVAGTPIVPKGGNADCGFAAPQDGPPGVSFMVVKGRIARVDVTEGPVKTLSGAGVGDTEAQTQARYANALVVSPAKYLPGGHDLTLVPSDAADTPFRLIFETDGKKVTRFRAGRQPEVSYVEGCS